MFVKCVENLCIKFLCGILMEFVICFRVGFFVLVVIIDSVRLILIGESMVFFFGV